MIDHEKLWLYAVFCGIAIWGGVVSYYRKLARGLRHTWLRLFGEVFTSAFAGFSVGALMLTSGASEIWSAAMAGVAGHMGGKAIDVLEDGLRSAAYRLFNIDRRSGDDQRHENERRHPSDPLEPPVSE